MAHFKFSVSVIFKQHFLLNHLTKGLWFHLASSGIINFLNFNLLLWNYCRNSIKLGWGDVWKVPFQKFIWPPCPSSKMGGCHCSNCMVVEFTTTYAISAYHHCCCEFESQSGRGVQHYVIKFVSDLGQVSGFLRVLRFPPPIKLIAMI